MNDYCVPLHININPCVKDIFDLSTYNIDPKVLCHRMIPLEDITQEYKDFLRAHGLELHLVELFYNPPRKVTDIHTDVVSGDISKINFVYCDAKSLMCWYQPKEGVALPETEVNVINKRVLNYTREQVSIAHKECLHSPSIVQVGVPHNIIVTTAARWCISTVYIKTDTKKRPTMAETLELFKDLVPQE
jgi:hypothetical protein